MVKRRIVLRRLIVSCQRETVLWNFNRRLCFALAPTGLCTVFCLAKNDISQQQTFLPFAPLVTTALNRRILAPIKCERNFPPLKLANETIAVESVFSTRHKASEDFIYQLLPGLSMIPRKNSTCDASNISSMSDELKECISKSNKSNFHVEIIELG